MVRAATVDSTGFGAGWRVGFKDPDGPGVVQVGLTTDVDVEQSGMEVSEEWVKES